MQAKIEVVQKLKVVSSYENQLPEYNLQPLMGTKLSLQMYLKSRPSCLVLFRGAVNMAGEAGSLHELLDLPDFIDEVRVGCRRHISQTAPDVFNS